MNYEPMSDLPTLNCSPTKSMLPIQISTEGIVKLFEVLSQQRAPGPDSITPTILKSCAEQVAPLLQQILKKSLDTGELPLDWQKANVSPIPKTGNRSDPANYRAVSLTYFPCQMHEHLIHTNSMRHLEQCKVLNAEQHGFRRGRSCETQLALSVNDLAKVLDRRSQADLVIMDFSKAFDLVPYQRLLSKLHQFGITGKQHNWITSGTPQRSKAPYFLFLT